jgi:hypothetical protein
MRYGDPGSEIGSIRPRLTRSQHMFRRFIHLISGTIVVFYLFPDTVLYLPKEIILILIIGVIPFIIEYTRLSRGIALFGQRPHETEAVGSYAWSLWASLFIILIFPQSIAVPVILIYSFADPVLSELRVWRKWSAFSFGFLFIWIMFMAFGFNLVLAGYGAIFMIIGESTELKGILRIRPELAKLYKVERDAKKWDFKFKTDDDGTTQVIPAFFLGLAYLFSPSAFPGPWLFPLF